MKISVVIPCYYSAPTIGKVVRQTREEVLKLGYDCEFVLVNDGSTDGTFAEIGRLAAEVPGVVGVNLMRNFGQHNAIMAGLHRVTGDWVMLMDDDMQTHPSQCHLLIEKMAEPQGWDVVFASYRHHRESAFRRLGSRFAMWSVRVLAGAPKGIVDSNFFIMKRCVSDVMVQYESPSVYVQGLVFRATNRIANVTVDHFEREQSTSGYTLKSLMSLWSTIINYSLTPLRIASVMGVLLSVVGIVSAVVIFIQRLSDPDMQLGWASVMTTLLVCSGFVIFTLGIVGEYLGRLFMTVSREPQFIVRAQVSSEGVVNAPGDAGDVAVAGGAGADASAAAADAIAAGSGRGAVANDVSRSGEVAPAAASSEAVAAVRRGDASVAGDAWADDEPRVTGA